MSQDFSDKLESFIVENGFIWGPEPEIYGGMSGFHTYGPLGKLLKSNVEDLISSHFEKDQFFELEAPFIQPKQVWEASGHLGTFVDPMIACNSCESDFRADKLIKEQTGKSADSFSQEEMSEFIEDNEVSCPSCGSFDWSSVSSYNLMVQTQIGKNKEAYNRPETATTTYLPFNRLFFYFRKKLPIKVFQIGKAWRNEISPRKSVVRGREFTQAEAQIILTEEMKHDPEQFDLSKFEVEARFSPEEHQKQDREPEKMSPEQLLEKDYINNQGMAYCLSLTIKIFDDLGIPADRIKVRQHHEKERAHYADDAWDFEVKTDSYGWIEACGVHDRTDYDLKSHSEQSNQDLRVNQDGEKVYPHVLEIAFGVDRPLYSLLDIFYEEDDRKLFQVPKKVAPVKAAVFPLVEKDGLPEIAREIHQKLIKAGIKSVYDDSGSIGRRYRRQDEKGTPLCITVDYDTKEDRTVTLRDRDSMDQVRVGIDQLPEKIEQFVDQGSEFTQLGEEV